MHTDTLTRKSESAMYCVLKFNGTQKPLETCLALMNSRACCGAGSSKFAGAYTQWTVCESL